MVEKTPNHELNKYDEGDVNWTHSPDMQTIEERLVIRDQEGDLNNYDPHPGATFVAIDSGAVYDGDGSSWNKAGRQYESTSANKIKINNQITWPDGTTTTTSPGGTGSQGSFGNTFSGVMYVDSTGDYVAKNLLNTTTWTDSNDAGTVLQSLADDLDNIKNDRVGTIRIGPGSYHFSTSVVLDRHPGVGFIGNDWRQSNQMSSTVFKANGLGSGKGILEFGSVGDENNAGWAAGAQVRHIRFDGNGEDVNCIYNWSQDRLLLDGVKSDNVGSGGHGLVIIGCSNGEIRDCYFVQAAILSNNARGKGTNSTRLYNVTFNTGDANTPPLIMSGDGNMMSMILANTVDNLTGSLNRGAIVSGNSDLANISDSDYRVDSSDYYARLVRIRWNQLVTVGGAPIGVDTSGLRSLFSGCLLRGGDVGIKLRGQATLTNSQIQTHDREGVILLSNASSTNVENCAFHSCGESGNHPGLTVEDGNVSNAVISGCSFSNSGGTYDIDASGAEGLTILGNRTPSGIKGPSGSWLMPGSNESTIIADNPGYNPVGFTRPAPSLPGGTGNSNAVDNDYPQGVWVYQEGGSGITVNQWGDDHSFNTDTNSFYVPRFSSVYFSDSTPSAWDWWWV
jgi:hypothetical protein